MKIRYIDFDIEVTNEINYSMGSVDNQACYEKEYYKGIPSQLRVHPIAKHGIRVKQNGTELASVIISEEHGGTTIHGNSFLIADNYLLICCSSYIYSFTLPLLEISWRKRLDAAACLGVYEFGDGLIIHGELSVTKIDREGNEKWSFYGDDIFVTQDESESINVYTDRIELIDWEGNQYVLDENGLQIN